MTRRISYSPLLLILLVGLVLIPCRTFAQSTPPGASLTAGLALTGQWDDETDLGRGVLVTGGVSTLATPHVRLEAELGWGRHERSGAKAGALEATGTPLSITGRAAWLIGGTSSQARPFISAGLSVVHSRGTFRSVDPVQRQSWRVTRPAWETGVGVEVAAGPRLRWRPEARLSMTMGGADASDSPLAMPLLGLRAGVSMIW